MKRHFLGTTLVLIAASLFLSVLFNSCLKEEYLKDENGEYVTDPLGNKVPNDSTIIYITQEIPNINEFMPDTLLYHMNRMGALHFGTEPPRIEGQFLADSIFAAKTIFIPGSPYHSIVEGSRILGDYHFKLYDQIWSVLKCDFTRPYVLTPTAYYNECATDDSTHNSLNDHLDIFKALEKTPPYFKTDDFDANEFGNTYLIGTSPYFTIFFYQVLRNEYPVVLPIGISPNDFHLILANIISGKLRKDAEGETYIDEFTWGRQCLGYLRSGNTLEQAILNGYQPCRGDAWICTNSGKPLRLSITEPTTDNE